MNIMITRICTLFIFFSTFISYSQDVTLLKNFNPKVKELKHDLNYSKDSLSLKCESKIMKVDIFNEDYEQSFEIKDFQTLIPLKDIPVGKFVVEVYLTNKIAEMHIIKHNLDNSLTRSERGIDIAEGQGMMLDEELNVIKSPPKNSIEFLLTRSKANQSSRVKQKFFWVILEVNTGNNSYKSMKLVNESIATKMISRNKLVRKTSYGKLNKLSVWEIYNKTEFMKKQASNPDYINSSSSDLFNVVPYYMTTPNQTLATM